jgi:hypothetical protein
MAQPMRKLVWRRYRNLALLVAIALLSVVLDQLTSTTLERAPALTGWVLFVLIVGLTSYNIRKKLPFLPLGSSATWLQFHIYAGLLTFVIFAVHVNWRVPNGVLESILTGLYLGVFVSGLLGLLLSRLIAKRLTTRGPEIIFERIGRARSRARAAVERLVLDSVAETDSTAVPEFYATRLESYFKGPGNRLSHLLQSTRSRRRLLDEVEAQQRFLNDRERDVMRHISDYIHVKEDLDYQHVHQAVLKYWLFVHIPLTYMLLVFAVVHVLVVYAFSGGFR